jgi:O-antigen ligase
MLSLALTGFLATFLAFGLKRPFVWVLAYIYVDVVSPQKIAYSILPSLPVSLIVFAAAFGGWMLADDKRGIHFAFRQWLLVMLLVYCGYTTLVADFPVEAAAKWSWVWKALVFAIFLPLTLRTRLRIEAAALVMVLSVASIVISGGIKTLVSGGGGYGTLSSFSSENVGLYEGSTLSMAAIAIIPLTLWLARFGTVFKRHWTVFVFAVALAFACLLIPVGTQTRTGLLCIALLGVLVLRTAKRRFLWAGLMAAASLVAIPFLPASYTERMGTIENHQADQSASTRVAVWKWTLQYAADHPLGGGFDAFLGNQIRFETKDTQSMGDGVDIESTVVEDKARAYHSAYFEMLGEQGWPGLFLWLALHGLGLLQLEMLRFRLRKSDDPLDMSDRSLAVALQQGHMVYLLGAAFIGIAFQPFVYMLVGLQIALVQQVRRRRDAARGPAWRAPRELKPLAAGGGS